jgi:stage V sporulation protein S
MIEKQYIHGYQLPIKDPLLSLKRRITNMDAVKVRDQMMNVVYENTPGLDVRPVVNLIKVSGTSRTSAVAGAIAGVVRDHNRADIQAIGASAINQATKAMILARGYLLQDGINVVCIPEFVDVEIDGKVRTAVKFAVEPR